MLIYTHGTQITKAVNRQNTHLSVVFLANESNRMSYLNMHCGYIHTRRMKGSFSTLKTYGKTGLIEKFVKFNQVYTVEISIYLSMEFK